MFDVSYVVGNSNRYIVSDCDAVALLNEQQHYAKSDEEAVADVLKAGMDVSYIIMQFL